MFCALCLYITRINVYVYCNLYLTHLYRFVPLYVHHFAFCAFLCISIYKLCLCEHINFDSMPIISCFKGMVVAGITNHSATTANEVMRLLQKGNKNRTVEQTNANKHSSRSHAILQVKIYQLHQTIIIVLFFFRF